MATKSLIKDCLQLIRKRQKLIKIADKSEFGWLVAREYDEDEIASNSDDDKRLKKAEKASMAKYKRRSQRNVRRLDARYSGFNSKPCSPGGFREYNHNGNETKIFVPLTTLHHRSTQPDSGVLPVETMDIGEPSATQSRCSDSKTDRISTHPSSQTSNSKLKRPNQQWTKSALKI